VDIAETQTLQLWLYYRLQNKQNMYKFL